MLVQATECNRKISVTCGRKVITGKAWKVTVLIDEISRTIRFAG